MASKSYLDERDWLDDMKIIISFSLVKSGIEGLRCGRTMIQEQSENLRNGQGNQDLN